MTPLVEVPSSVGVELSWRWATSLKTSWDGPLSSGWPTLSLLWTSALSSCLGWLSWSREEDKISSSSRYSLATGRTYVPSFVLTSTFLTTPSALGSALVTRPSGHFPRFVPSSPTITSEPSVMFGVLFFHFDLVVKVGKYSLTHLFQNWAWIAWTFFHCFRLVISLSLVSAIDSQFWCWPRRIWLGVKASRFVTSSER